MCDVLQLLFYTPQNEIDDSVFLAVPEHLPYMAPWTSAPAPWIEL